MGGFTIAEAISTILIDIHQSYLNIAWLFRYNNLRYSAKGAKKTSRPTSIRNFINAADIDCFPSVHLAAKCTRSWIYNSSQPVGTTQWLIGLESVPRIDNHVVFPESLPLKVETLLFRNFDSSYSLPRVFLRIPDLASVFDRLVLKILTQLDLKQVLCVMSGVKVL